MRRRDDRGVSIHSYPLASFPFQSLLLRHFNKYVSVPRLEDLHRCVPYSWLPHENVTPENDQSGECLRVAYQIFDPSQSEGSFLDTYRRFLDFVYGKSISQYLFQRRPTFRLQFPGGLAGGSIHRDRDFGHLPETENVWLPLTTVERTSTIWIETPGQSELRPILPKPGEYLMFSGDLLHGNVPSQSQETRMSFDFRAVPRRLAQRNLRARTRVSQIPLFGAGERSYFVERQFV